MQLEFYEGRSLSLDFIMNRSHSNCWDSATMPSRRQSPGFNYRLWVIYFKWQLSIPKMVLCDAKVASRAPKHSSWMHMSSWFQPRDYPALILEVTDLQTTEHTCCTIKRAKTPLMLKLWPLVGPLKSQWASTGRSPMNSSTTTTSKHTMVEFFRSFRYRCLRYWPFAS